LGVRDRAWGLASHAYTYFDITGTEVFVFSSLNTVKFKDFNVSKF